MSEATDSHGHESIDSTSHGASPDAQYTTARGLRQGHSAGSFENEARRQTVASSKTTGEIRVRLIPTAPRVAEADTDV